MLRHIAAFETRHQLRQPLLWGTASVFAMMSFVATVTDAFQISGGIGSLNRNAPYIVVRTLADLSLVGTFIVVAFAATAVLRDFERRTDEIMFSRPISARVLLLGRFLGSLAASALCFLPASLGLLIGSVMPWLDPQRIGPTYPWAHVYGLFALALPNFAIVAAIFFAVATRVRHLAGVYAGLVALLVAYFVASAMFADLESRATAAFLDPFGLTALDLQTRYWTIVEKNSRVPRLDGFLLWNRIFWLVLATGALAWAISTFRYERAARTAQRRLAKQEPPPGEQARVRIRRSPAFQAGTSVSQLRSAFRVEVRSLLRSVPFLLVLAFGLINVLANMGYLELMLGTPVWPVTHLMLLAISAGYSFLLVLILTFYSGETIWRERALGVDAMLDATPTPSWVPLTAKVLALWVSAAVFILAGVIGLIGFQLTHGYTRLEPGLYLQGFFVELVPFLLVAVMAVFLHVLVNQKYVGYLLMVLFVISGAALTALHFDHHLYRYARAPSAPYSDMNGWGHFAAAVFWFDAYWACVAAALFCLSYLGWVRGSDSRWKLRMTAARQRLRGRAGWALMLAAVAAAGIGTFIFYNTNILNEYAASDEAERRRAEYEQRYRRHRNVEQLRITSVSTTVDIFPADRRAEVRGTYRAANRSGKPLSTLHVVLSPRVKVQRIELPPHRLVVADRRLGYFIYELAAPVDPDQEISIGFSLEISNPGFVNNNPDNAVVENGTFFHVAQLPALGYQDSRELGDPAARRRHGLPPVIRAAKIDDMRARQDNDLASDADWIDFETTISTSPDQIALAPGNLRREWTDGQRRYFEYQAQSPIPKFFSFLSGRYAVRRDSWKGIGIEVYYHPGHPYNIERMVDAVKKSLRYLTENFSPYQHSHVRIVEFPRYTRGAVSFPNTIPFSESIGFIARLEDPADIDYPFYITAHEVAHQWWGYQVLGADVQGAAMLSESMAQYSSLMVMRREYGAKNMRRFLKYELDGYLSGRGGELVEEMSLELVEDQPYIHYRKGSLVLYALQDALGEDVLNAALRRYIASVRLQARPYTVSRDLLAFVAEVTPPEKRRFVDDLFAKITLFDLRTARATARPVGDGRYEVTLRAEARKLRADGQGNETEVPIDDWIDVGIFGENDDEAEPRILYLKKHHVNARDVDVRVVVQGAPARAGIDPFNVLIDRLPSDNVRPVTAP